MTSNPGDLCVETESPPEKKPKLNEEEEEDEEIVESSSRDIIVSIYDDESVQQKFIDEEYERMFCPTAGMKMDQELWDRYYQQIDESEGFDIIDYPGNCIMTEIIALPYYLEDPENVACLTEYSSRALQLYNEDNGTDYKVKEILTVNCQGGCRACIFYITLTVESAKGEEEIFQAKVVEDIGCPLKILIIRPKSKKGSDMK